MKTTVSTSHLKNSRKDRFNALYSPPLPVVSYEENTFYSLISSSSAAAVSESVDSSFPSSSSSSSTLIPSLGTVPSTEHKRRNSITDLAAELAKDRGKNVVQLAGAFVTDNMASSFSSSSSSSSSSSFTGSHTLSRSLSPTPGDPPPMLASPSSSVSSIPPVSVANSPMVARIISRVLYGPPPASPFSPPSSSSSSAAIRTSTTSSSSATNSLSLTPATNRRPVLGLSSKAGNVINQFGYLMDYNLDELVQRTGYNREQLYSHWLRYKALCTLSKSDVGIDRETFREHIPCLTVEDDAFVHRVFTLLDVDGSGTIEWEEFLTALTALEKGSKTLRTEFLFKSYDKDGTGKLTIDNLYEFFIASLFMNRSKAETKRPEALTILRNFAERIFNELDTENKGSITLMDALEHIHNQQEQKIKNDPTLHKLTTSHNPKHSSSTSTLGSSSTRGSTVAVEDISTFFGRVMIVGKEADPASVLEIDHETVMNKLRYPSSSSPSSRKQNNRSM